MEENKISTSTSLEGFLEFTRLSPNAYAPTKASEYAAGYDLYSAYNYTVPSQSREIIKIELRMKFPPGTYGRIAPKSGLAARHFISIGAGVVDSDFEGPIQVILFNHHKLKSFKIKKGDAIAQLICEKITLPTLREIPNSQDSRKRPENADPVGPTVSTFPKRNSKKNYDTKK